MLVFLFIYFNVQVDLGSLFDTKIANNFQEQDKLPTSTHEDLEKEIEVGNVCVLLLSAKGKEEER